MTDTTDSSAYGQQSPDDANSELATLLFVIRQQLARIDTIKLVKVMAVHPGTGTPPVAGTVDIMPLVNLLDGQGNATKNGTIYGVPWLRLKGGTSAIVIDPMVGDIGLALVSDRDISNVVAAAAAGNDPQTNPGSLRRLNVSDSIYLGGVLDRVSPKQYLAFADKKITLADENGNTVVLDATGITATDKTGNVIQTSSTGIAMTPKAGLPVTVNGSLVVTQNLQLGGTVQAQAGGVYGGNIVTSGQVTAGGIGLTTHHHTQPNDSHGDTEGPTSAAVA